MTYVPPVRINSADDLEAAVKWAGENEKTRWYVARMARAYKRSDLIPKDWDVTESEQPNERRLTSEQDMVDSAVIDDAIDHEAPITAAAGKKRRTQKIQTQAGVKRYGAPIGTPIIKKDGKLVADTSAVVRLRSETGDEKASPKAPNNKIVATPPENIEEGDEIVTKKGVELVVVSSTPNDNGGYTIVVEDADGLAQSFDIDKTAKIQLLEDDDEDDDDAPERPQLSAREKLDDDFKNERVSVTEHARKKGLIDSAEIQDGQAKGEIKPDDELTAADVNAAYKRWNDLKKAKAPKPEIERAERQYKHVHKTVTHQPPPEKGAPNPEVVGPDNRDAATKAKHDKYDAARANDLKAPAKRQTLSTPVGDEPRLTVPVPDPDEKFRAHVRTPKHIGDPAEDSDLGRAEQAYASTKAAHHAAVDKHNATHGTGMPNTPEGLKSLKAVRAKYAEALDAEEARDKAAGTKLRPTDAKKRASERRASRTNARDTDRELNNRLEYVETLAKDAAALPWDNKSGTVTIKEDGPHGYTVKATKNGDDSWDYTITWNEGAAQKNAQGTDRGAGIAPNEAAVRAAITQALGEEAPAKLAQKRKLADQEQSKKDAATAATTRREQTEADFNAARDAMGKIPNGDTSVEAAEARLDAVRKIMAHTDAVEAEYTAHEAAGNRPSRQRYNQFVPNRDRIQAMEAEYSAAVDKAKADVTPSEPDDTHKLQHRAPTRHEEDAVNITNLEDHYPGVFDRPDLYEGGRDPETMRSLRAMKANPDAEVTIYRAAPSTVTTINDGDWVSLSRKYATEHGFDSDDDGKDMPVISQKVRARDLYSEGNSLQEWGYSPEPSKPTKLTDPHTAKPGDNVTVTGKDAYGADITLTGTVVSNNAESTFEGTKKRGTGIRSITIQREGASGMNRQDTLTVPDPERPIVTRTKDAEGSWVYTDKEPAKPAGRDYKAEQQARTVDREKEAADKTALSLTQQHSAAIARVKDAVAETDLSKRLPILQNIVDDLQKARNSVDPNPDVNSGSDIALTTMHAPQVRDARNAIDTDLSRAKNALADTERKISAQAAETAASDKAAAKARSEAKRAAVKAENAAKAAPSESAPNKTKEWSKDGNYYHKNSWKEEVTPDDDTVVWNAHRPLRGQQFEGQSRYGIHYASAKRSDPDFNRIAEENRKLDAQEITLVDNNDLIDLHESERIQSNGRYSVQTYLENDLPVSESMQRLRLPWDKSDTSADARIERMKTGNTEPEAPSEDPATKRVAERRAAVDAEVERTKAEWKEKSAAAAAITDKTSREHAQAKFEALVAKNKAGRAYADQMSAVYEAGEGPRGTDYDAKRAAWSRNMEMTNQAIASITKELAAHDKRDAELQRQGFGGRAFDHGEQQLPLNGRNGRGMTDAQLRRGVEANKAVERAASDARSAELKAKDSTPQADHDPARDRDPNTIRNSKSYDETLKTWMGNTPNEFITSYDSAKKDAQKAGDEDSRKAKVARMKLAMYSAIGEDTGMLKNGRVKRSERAATLKDVADKNGVTPAVKEPEETLEDRVGARAAERQAQADARKADKETAYTRESAGFKMDDTVRVTLDRNKLKWTVIDIAENGDIVIQSEKFNAMHDRKTIPAASVAKRVSYAGGEVDPEKTDTTGFATTGSDIKLGDVVQLGNGSREYRVSSIRTNGDTELTQLEGANTRRVIKRDEFSTLTKIRDDDTQGTSRPLVRIDGSSDIEQKFETQDERIERRTAENMASHPFVRRQFIGTTKERIVEQILQSGTHAWQIEISERGGDHSGTWEEPRKRAHAQEAAEGTPFVEGGWRAKSDAREKKIKDTLGKHYQADLSGYSDTELANLRRAALDVNRASATDKQHRDALRRDQSSLERPLDEAYGGMIVTNILHNVAVEQQRRIDNPAPAAPQAPAAITVNDLLGGNKDTRSEKLQTLTQAQLDDARAKSGRISSQLKARGRLGDRGTILKHERLQASILDENIRRGVANGTTDVQELTDGNLTTFLQGESYSTGELAREFGVNKATMLRRLTQLRDQGVLESSVDEDSAGASGTTSVSGGRTRIADLNWMLAGGRDVEAPTTAPNNLALQQTVYDKLQELTTLESRNQGVGKVRVSDLRNAMGTNVTPQEFEAALVELNKNELANITIYPDDNQKALTAENLKGSFVYGGKRRDTISVDPGVRPGTVATPTPAPRRETPTGGAKPDYAAIQRDQGTDALYTELNKLPDSKIHDIIKAGNLDPNGDSTDLQDEPLIEWTANAIAARNAPAPTPAANGLTDQDRADIEEAYRLGDEADRASYNGDNGLDEQLSDQSRAIFDRVGKEKHDAYLDERRAATENRESEAWDALSAQEQHDRHISLAENRHMNARKKLDWEMSERKRGRENTVALRTAMKDMTEANKNLEAAQNAPLVKVGIHDGPPAAEKTPTPEPVAPKPADAPAVSPVAQRRRDIIDGARNPEPTENAADTAAAASEREYNLDQALEGKVDAAGDELTAGKHYRINRGSKAWVIESMNKDGKSFTMVGAEPDSTGKSRRRLKVTPAMMKPFTEPSSPSTPDVPSTPNTPADAAPNLEGLKDNAGNALDLSLTYALNNRGGRGWTIDSVTDTGLINLSIPSGSDGKRRRWNVDPKKLRPVGGTTTSTQNEPTPTPAPAPEPLASDDQLADLRRRLAERNAETPEDTATRQSRDRANALGALQQEARSLQGVLNANEAARIEVEAAQTSGNATRIEAAQLRHARTQKDAIMARSDYRRALREAKIAGVPGEQFPETPEAQAPAAPQRRATGGIDRPRPTAAQKRASAQREREARIAERRRQQIDMAALANDKLDDPAEELAAAQAAYDSVKNDRLRRDLLGPIGDRVARAQTAMTSQPSAAPKPEPVVAKPEAPAAPTPAPEADIPTPAGATRAPTHKIGQTSRVLNVLLRTNQRKIDEINGRITNGEATADDRASLKLYEREMQKLRGEVERGEWQSPDALAERAIANGKPGLTAPATPPAPARKDVGDMTIDELSNAINDPDATEAQIDAAIAEMDRRDAAEQAANAPRNLSDLSLDELEAIANGADTPEADMLAALDEMDRRERGDGDTGGTPAPTPDPTPIDDGWGASDPADDDDNSKAAQILRRIEQGENPLQAEADVTGKSLESIMRRDGLAWLRATYSVSGTNRFEDALTEAYQQAVNQSVIDSEEYTRGGYHINSQARTRGNLSARTDDLFVQTEATALANASTELREYWDENGRITKDGFRNRVWAAIGAPGSGTGRYSGASAGGFNR